MICLHRRAWLAFTAAPLLLAGCGFALRQAPEYAFDSIWLDLPASPFRAELQRQIEGSGPVRVFTEAPGPDQAPPDATLHSSGVQREETIVSMTSAGEVREVQLRMWLEFHVRAADGRELLSLSRIERQMDQSYSESESLSKAQERELLYANMQSDIVQQVMRRLEAVSP